MDLRRTTLLILSCLAVVGCRKDPYMDAYFEMLNSEKRVLEDRLYALEYDYKKALKELESYRAGKTTADGRTKPEPERGSEPARQPEEDTDEMFEPDIPEIELPPGFESGYQQPSKQPAFRTASIATRQADTDRRLGSRKLNEQELAEAVIAALDRDVDHIVINARATGGADFDQQLGDDGLTVLVEPRTKQGHFVAESGPMTLVLLDPELSGQAARVARWEIDAGAARRALETESLDRGLMLQLPWPGERPEHERLNLFVRYHASDGRVLEAEQAIRVQATDRVVHSWTPRSPRSREDDQRDARVAESEPVDRSTESAVVQASAEEEVIIPSDTSASSPTSRSQDDRSATVPGRFWKPNR